MKTNREKIEELWTQLDELKSKRRKSKASDEEDEDKSCLETSDSDVDDLIQWRKDTMLSQGIRYQKFLNSMESWKKHYDQHLD